MTADAPVTNHILVVDDDPAIRSMLRAVLTDEGYAVETAGDGLEALARVDESRPDVIVLDLMMPRMDGIAFYRELLARGNASTPAVIVVTARHVNAEMRRALPRAAPIVAKPFDLDDLLVQVARQLEEA